MSWSVFELHPPASESFVYLSLPQRCRAASSWQKGSWYKTSNSVDFACVRAPCTLRTSSLWSLSSAHKCECVHKWLLVSTCQHFDKFANLIKGYPASRSVTACIDSGTCQSLLMWLEILMMEETCRSKHQSAPMVDRLCCPSIGSSDNYFLSLLSYPSHTTKSKQTRICQLYQK